MSLHTYNQAKEIALHQYDVEALIMAAAMRGDATTVAILDAGFPDVVQEARDRYNAPGGLLPGEPGYEQIQAVRSQLNAFNQAWEDKERH